MGILCTCPGRYELRRLGHRRSDVRDDELVIHLMIIETLLKFDLVSVHALKGECDGNHMRPTAVGVTRPTSCESGQTLPALVSTSHVSAFNAMAQGMFFP